MACSAGLSRAGRRSKPGSVETLEKAVNRSGYYRDQVAYTSVILAGSLFMWKAASCSIGGMLSQAVWMRRWLYQSIHSNQKEPDRPAVFGPFAVAVRVDDHGGPGHSSWWTPATDHAATRVDAARPRGPPWPRTVARRTRALQISGCLPRVPGWRAPDLP